MATNEILFWSLVIVTWGLSLVAAYFFGRDRAYKDAIEMIDHAMEMIDQSVSEIVHQKLDELKKQPPIR